MKKLLFLFSILVVQVTSAQNGYWTQVGMLKFPFNPSVQTTGLGRISDVAFHPSNNQIIYAVSSSGGLFKTENEALTWKAISDTLIALNCASVAVKPDNGNYILLGTGDANYNSTTKAKGVYRSIDGGKTWTLSNTGMGNKLVSKMYFHPTQTNLVWAACNDGIYKSVDAGITWTLKTTVVSSYRSLELKANPTTNTLYAATNTDFYYSINLGETWTQLSHTGTGFDTQGSVAMSAIKIGVSPADTNVVYAVVWDPTHRYGGLFKSADSGLNWSLQSYATNPSTVTNPNILGYQADGVESTLNGQGAYNLAIAVDRVNINTIYVGAINIWRSTDAGVTWTCKSHWGYGVHADKHYLGYSPHYSNPYKMYCANDGGMYRTLDDWSTWSEISQGIAATEFTKLGQSPVYKEVLLSGTQDNGLNLERDLDFYTIKGGDWYGDFEFDPKNPNIAYYHGGKRRVTKSGGAETDILNPNGTRGYYLCHEIDSNFLFAYDTNLYRSSNIKTAVATNIVWSKLTNNLFNSNTALIVKAKCSNIDPNLIVMLRNDKLIIKSNNILSTTPAFTSYPTPAFATPTTSSCIEINRVDPTILYVAIGNKIYRSTNQGQSWADYSGTLPAKTILKVIHDKYSTDESVYICNSASVYYRNNTMSDWISYSNGLPAIADIVDMELVDDGTPNGVLRTAFYGRGIFQSALRRNYTQSPTALFNYYTIPSSCNNLLIFNDQSVGQLISSRLWTISPSNAATFVNNSSNTSQSPQIQFNTNTGNCSISLTITNSVGSSTYTKSFNFAQLINNALCTPTYTSGTGSGDLISRVRIGSLDNTSSGASSPYYTNYACINSTTISTNQSYSLTINFGSDATQYCGAWIDYNNDNTFTTSEWIGGNTTNAGANGTYTINFTVPPTATLGTVRLRIRGGDDAALQSSGFCSPGVWGETEDYPIIISSSYVTTCTNLTLPYNHQILNTVTTTLTWEYAVGATSYDIYLGTDANPLFYANTIALSYAVNLFSSTQYYWTIIPKFGNSSLPSCEIRDFISGPFPYPPSCTNLLSPINNDLQSNSVTLTWVPVTEATNYDVYCGTTNPPTTLVASNSTQTSFNLANLTNGIRYYWYVVPKNSMGTASGCNTAPFAFDVGATTSSNYCIPTYTSGGSTDVITRVRLSNLDNTSAGNTSPYYTYFSNLASTNLNLNNNYNLIINFGSDPNQFCAAWIDYNQDGVFDSSTEFLGNNPINAGANGTYTINFTVPSNASTGLTRLRIRGGDDAALTNIQACGISNSNFGQTEDYILNILPDNSITLNSTIPSALCSSSTININYTTAGTFNTGNDFILQLSDATGSFASPTTIGTITATSSGSITGTIPNVNGNYYRIRIASTNPSTISNLNTQNISIKSSGNWLGVNTDWNNINNWCGGTIPTSTTDVFIGQNTPNMPSLSANAVCNNLYLETGSTLNLNGFELVVYGQFQGAGQLIGSTSSSLTINGSGNAGMLNFSQTNSNNSALKNLTINRISVGSVYIVKPIQIYGEVVLNNGTLFTADMLTLKSDALSTARIAPVASSALIKGNVTVERFTPGGLTGWAMIASPVESAQIQDWQDDFPTSGFSGATGWAGMFNSVFDYSEGIIGTLDNGFNPATSSSNLLVPGKGKWVYLGNGLTNTTDLIIDVQGPVKVGNISLPISYTISTPSALPNDDGWNLVANPYPSSIDWSSASINKTNMNDAVYIYNTDNHNFATYAAGVGVNGGSQFIAASQAFWVKAHSTNPSLIVSENAKSIQNTTFLKTNTNNQTNTVNDLIKIKLQSISGQDEIAIVFDPLATSGSNDSGDAPKLIQPNSTSASLYTLSNNQEMAINKMNPANNNAIPLVIYNESQSLFSLQFNVTNCSYATIYLWDSKQNQYYDLNQNPMQVLNWLDTSAFSNDRYFLLFDNLTTIESEQSYSTFELYPNPASDEIFIHEVQQGSLCLFNYIGQKVLELSIQSGPNRVNISNLSSGVYNACFTSHDVRKNVRIIKR